MDRHATPSFIVVGAQPADPGHCGYHGVRLIPCWNVRPQVDQRMASWVALPVPGPTPTDGKLDLDHRLEPVDVGTFEQAGLDQAHGSGRIASWRRLDWPA